MAVCYLFIAFFLFIPEKTLSQQVCPPRDIAFELITGFVFTSPNTIVDTRPGVLKLDECIDACRRNSTCLSVNYETGLCVLFSSSAEKTPGKRNVLDTLVSLVDNRWQGHIWCS